MKNAVHILRIFMLGVCASVFFLLFCLYTIPGALLWLFWRERYPRWIGSAVALSITVLFRFLSGRWNVVIGGQPSGASWLEVMQGAVSWAIGSILVLAGYNIVAFFVKGWREGRTHGVELRN